MKRILLIALLASYIVAIGTHSSALAHDHHGHTKQAIVRSKQSGDWSNPATWSGGKCPAERAVVQVKGGHEVRYDVNSATPIRAVHVAGRLIFASDRDTRLVVGLLRVQPGDDCTEEGFDCTIHLDGHPDGTSAKGHADIGHDAKGAQSDRPELLIGTPDEPIAAAHTAQIQLAYFEGMNKESLPAVVCCGGRMELHGQSLDRTWLKLGQTAKVGGREVVLEQAPGGWRVGDRVIVVATNFPRLTRDNPDRNDTKAYREAFINTVREATQTEERIIEAIDGNRLTLDKPLEFEHQAEGAYQGEVANLSRNVVVESLDPAGERGHTMYHAYSAGSIGYAEFRNLGKKDVLGRYSLHYHLVGDTMRGSSVIGASIWNSDNRWLTVHGTNHLVVRDCVGYNSIGHGFFLEDGTEVDNVFDRNLAVQAALGKQLPKQVLPFDFNDGAGFWWANCLNMFTRNVAAECDQHGFRFEAAPEHGFSPVLPIRQPSGEFKKVDIRTLPFIKFENNEVHSQRRFGLNLGGIRGVATFDELTADREVQDQKVRSGHVQGVGPDREHPFVIKGFKAWTTHWVFHGGSPSVIIDGLDSFDCNYGIWRSRMDMHEYSNLSMRQMKQKHFFHPWGGTTEVSDSYEQNLKATDDRPPTTVITHITRETDRKVRVRGTTADASPIQQVLVNGHSVSANEQGEWELLLDFAESGVVEAAAEDIHGNKEGSPHKIQLVAADKL